MLDSLFHFTYRLLPKIERGLGAERARLGTFRGLGTPVKNED